MPGVTELRTSTQEACSGWSPEHGLGDSRLLSGDKHQEHASSLVRCPDDGPQLRGSAHSPKALGSPGIRSGQLYPGDGTFPTCFLKSLNSKDLQNKPRGGRTDRNPAELKPEHHWPGLWGSGMTPAFQQTGRGRPHSPTFWMQRLRLRAGTHVLKPRSPVCQEEGVPVDFGVSACAY